MSGTSTQPPETSKPGLNGFEETVKDFWASRPRRPKQGRKVAGVAAGIGNRYGIDPVVVRVALVAATVFGGIGIGLYVVGWLLFADEHDEVSPIEGLIGRGQTSMNPAFTVVLACSLFFVIPWSFAGNWFDGGGFFGLGLILLALYLLHRSRGQFNRPAVPPAPGHDAGFTMTDGGTTVSSSPDAPPRWDPLGAAPFAWDLPDPHPAPVLADEPPAPPVPRRRTSPIGKVTFAVALVTAGVLTTLGISGVGWFSPAHIIGVTLGVLGVGLVAGALTGGGRGLIGLAVPLSIAGVALTAVPFHAVGGGVGNLDATPRSAAELRPVYEQTAGNIDLDLTELPPDTPVTATVRSSVGNSTVIVPDNADVQVTCESPVGDIECLGREHSGLGNAPITVTDQGSDGPGGPKYNLTVTTSAGNVEVRRG
ncbi:PspC domain-containing protein [Amycolatopsis albispora]|uniref:PspC family transcriptional regulator n=1 Tax=Amycolatopsis albispora TaxID=1804986 RepID=A0A344LFT7_9PSEU|nr:PspC domain-containing protein [Amycolatopsis albispora]AXB46911.1 PspC family transcriptional regulator [Amycolatopsis albispora]